MKKNILIYTLAFFMLAGCTSKLDFTAPVTPVTPTGGTADLIISEVSTAINTDKNGGGKRNHYVELYNATTSSIDLSNYAIGYQATDSSNLNSIPWSFPDTTVFKQLSGSLAASTCFVIASPQADTPTVLSKSQLIWGDAAANPSKPLSLSGNSAIALLKKADTGTVILGGIKYAIIDVFCSPLVARIKTTGKVSVRNNYMWPIGDTTNDTRNRTFWRVPTVTAPQSDWTISNATGNSQWKVSKDKVWDYSNIGFR